MSTIVVVLIVVGLVAALYGFNYLTGKATNAASRQIFKKSYEKGRSEVHRELNFQAPIGPEELLERIIRGVNPHASAPAVAGGLYLEQRSGNTAVFALGNKVSTAMRSRVVVHAADAGSAGRFDVLQWKESGASVMGSKSVGPLIERIEAAVQNAGGTTTQG